MEIPQFVKDMGDGMAARASKHSKVSKGDNPGEKLTLVGKFMKSVAKTLGSPDAENNIIEDKISCRYSISKEVALVLGNGAGAKIGNAGERLTRRQACKDHLGSENSSQGDVVSYKDAKVLVGLLSGSGPLSIETFFSKSGSSVHGEKLKDKKVLTEFLKLHGVPPKVREALVDVLSGKAQGTEIKKDGLVESIGNYQPEAEENKSFEKETDNKVGKTWDNIRLEKVLHDSLPGL